MRRPAAERRLFFRALWRVATVRLALAVRPFAQVRAWTAALARRRPNVDRTPDAHLVGWSVRSASRLVPGASCLTQAMAAYVMLEQYDHGSVLHVGVSRDRGAFEAHAWVECHGSIVIGELDRHDFVPLPEVTPTTSAPLDRM